MKPDAPPVVHLPDPLPATLHLGCGRRKRPGALGVDIAPSAAADLRWDLDRVPWPLPGDAFETVVMIDVLEHVENVIAVMEEVYRVGRAGAAVEIQSPFAASHHLWTDPTHRRGFTSRSFKYFDPDFAAEHFEYTQARFRVREMQYRMWSPKWYDRLLLHLVHRYSFLYERRFMYWYPVENIFFRLEVVK